MKIHGSFGVSDTISKAKRPEDPNAITTYGCMHVFKEKVQCQHICLDWVYL